jgi:isoleucyl-tRNA synthetase
MLMLFGNVQILQGDDLVVAVDGEGRFKEKVTDFAGRYVKDTDKDIVSTIKASISDC